MNLSEAYLQFCRANIFILNANKQRNSIRCEKYHSHIYFQQKIEIAFVIVCTNCTRPHRVWPKRFFHYSRSSLYLAVFLLLPFPRYCYYSFDCCLLKIIRSVKARSNPIYIYLNKSSRFSYKIGKFALQQMKTIVSIILYCVKFPE